MCSFEKNLAKFLSNRTYSEKEIAEHRDYFRQGGKIAIVFGGGLTVRLTLAEWAARS